MGRKYGYGGENRGGTFGLTIISNMIFITENQVLNTSIPGQIIHQNIFFACSSLIL